MQVYFETREELTPGVWQYSFRPERPLQFVPGQYADFYLANTANDYRGPSRTFTLTSLPGEPLLSFVVKIPEPHSVYKQQLTELQSGDAAKINDAMGDLVLPRSAEIPLVFIAGGIGMASYASMIKQLLIDRDERQVFMFYALRSKRERIFGNVLKQYPLQLLTEVITPNRLTAAQILDSVPPKAQFYLSGSQKFVEQLQAQFEQAGVPRSQIVFDYYDGYSEL